MQRRSFLAMAVWPLGACSLQPLQPLRRERLALSQSAWCAPALGHQWTYQVLNFYNGNTVDTIHESVVALEPVVVIRRRSERHGELPEERQSRWGLILQDPVWDRTQVYDQAVPLWPADLQAGSQAAVRTRYRPLGASYRLAIEVSATVLGHERIELDGTQHETVHIERLIRLEHEDSSRLNFIRNDRIWLAPPSGRWVARETRGEYWRAGSRASPFREDHVRWVLQA